MIYFVIMYTSNTILYFNLICIFKFAFKHTLTSYNFFFCVFKTNIVYLIQLVPINIRFNILMWFPLSTYFLVFLQEGSIKCTLNNSIILFLPAQFISVCGIVTTVLRRPNFVILKTNVSQDLALIWRITRAMDEKCGLGPILHMVYVSFTVLARNITHIRVSIWRGGISSL